MSEKTLQYVKSMADFDALYKALTCHDLDELTEEEFDAAYFQADNLIARQNEYSEELEEWFENVLNA